MTWFGFGFLIFSLYQAQVDALSFVVKTESELRIALSSARAGDAIRIWNAPIKITGTLETRASGTPSSPITMFGLGSASELILYAPQLQNNGSNNCTSSFHGRALLDMDDINLEDLNFDMSHLRYLNQSLNCSTNATGPWNSWDNNCTCSENNATVNDFVPVVDPLFRIRHSHWVIQDLRFVVRQGNWPHPLSTTKIVLDRGIENIELRKNTFKTEGDPRSTTYGVLIHGSNVRINFCSFEDQAFPITQPEPSSRNIDIRNNQFVIGASPYSSWNGQGVYLMGKDILLQGNYFGVDKSKNLETGYGNNILTYWHNWAIMTNANVTVRNNWGESAWNSGYIVFSSGTDDQLFFDNNACDLQWPTACLRIWSPIRNKVSVRNNNVLISGTAITDVYTT